MRTTPSLLLARATRRLVVAGVETPAADARMLLCAALDTEPGRLALVDQVDDEQVDLLDEMVERRAAGEPAQYVIGSTWFRGFRVAVGPGVFIPRPETELVAGAAVDEAVRIALGGSSPTVIDLCTGSGAIAMAVDREVPAARVSAVEIDGQAVSWARRNLAGSEVHLLVGDALTTPQAAHQFDVVVTNPPYLRRRDEDAVDPMVREHEPDIALFSGADGLDLPLRLVGRSNELLRDGGLFVMEHDETHREVLLETMSTQSWEDVVDHDDLAGRPRFVTARARWKDGPHG